MVARSRWCAPSSVSDRQLIELMTGRAVEALFPKICGAPGPILFETDRLSLATGLVEEASMHVRAGEVVGISGLVGCGKSELIRAAFGLEVITGGTIRHRGQEIHGLTPRAALRAGICYFPSDRVAEGLALSRPVRENVSMAALDCAAFAHGPVLRRAEERRRVQRIVEKLRLGPPRIEQGVVNLSGGNRQKVVLARGMTRDLSVFLFDEPTVGIDVGAKFEVYEFIKSLAEGGAAIVLVSSELPEVMNLSQRLYVMHRARIVAELQGDEISEQRVLSHFFAGADHGGAPSGSRMSIGGDSGRPVHARLRTAVLFGDAGVLPVLFVLLVVVLSVTQPYFLGAQNIVNVLRNASFLMIAASGQMLVLIVGGLDLSIGAVIALTSVASASVMAGLPEYGVHETATIIGLGVAGRPRLRAIGWSGQRTMRRSVTCSAVHGDAGHDVDRQWARAAADQRHSDLRHAGQLCSWSGTGDRAGIADRPICSRCRRRRALVLYSI